MARPRKCRRVSTLPKVSVFDPIDLSLGVDEIIIMSVDEYESIRLIDVDGLNQEQCADSIGFVVRLKIKKIVMGVFII